MSESNCEIFCENFEPLMSSYQDGELEGDERAKVAAHLDGCPACSRLLAELDTVSKSLKNLPRLKAKKDYGEDIDQLIASGQKQNKIAYLRRPAFWATVSVAAAALIVVVAGHYVSRTAPSPSLATAP